MTLLVIYIWILIAASTGSNVRLNKVQKISKGMSGDEKYCVERDGIVYLLRVADGTDFPEKRESSKI